MYREKGIFRWDLKVYYCCFGFILTALSVEFYTAESSKVMGEVKEMEVGRNSDAEVQAKDLSAPLEILVEDLAPDSVTFTWKPPPPPKETSLKLFTYSLTLTPLSLRKLGQEKEFSLPPTITSKRVTGVEEGTKYAVQLSAVYGDLTQKRSRDNLRLVSAPKFTISIPVALQRDVPIGDDGLPIGEPACNCSEAGMVACTRRPGFVECTCQPGYTGKWCEECASGNFLVGKECKICPCSNVTSTAECKIDNSGQVSCIECLPGHRGSLCSSCSAGYHWTEDRCIALDCLSSSLCAEQRNAPGCEGCIFLEDHFPAPAQRSNSERAIADGTLPLIAVIVTLGILLLVAAMATCYRYWVYRRHQPRVPFWSIELQDEKSDLHAHCQYQHLDAATNKIVSETPHDSAEVGRHEGGRLTGETTSSRTYNTMNV